jgi:hypothetical protein
MRLDRPLLLAPFDVELITRVPPESRLTGRPFPLMLWPTFTCISAAPDELPLLFERFVFTGQELIDNRERGVWEFVVAIAALPRSG